MGQYLDILMPMIYRSDESGSGNDKGDQWAIDFTNFFADRCGNAEVWTGTLTYRNPGALGLPCETLRSHCEAITRSRATGIVLFRYAIGCIPDLSDLWD